MRFGVLSKASVELKKVLVLLGAAAMSYYLPGTDTLLCIPKHTGNKGRWTDD